MKIKRTSILAVPMDDEEKKSIEEYASKVGFSMSAVARIAIQKLLDEAKNMEVN